MKNAFTPGTDLIAKRHFFIIKQEAQRSCIAHQSFNEKHTSSLKSVICKPQKET